MRVLSMWLTRCLLIALVCIPLAAQNGSIAGPSIGFLVNDEGSTIWPLLGILGASVPGSPLPLPEAIADAVLSPQHDYAIARSTASGQPVIVKLDVSNPTITAVGGGRSNPQLMAVSPTGSAAALFEKESRKLQIVSGLPSAADVTQEFEVVLNDDVRRMAVSDDGRLVLLIAGSESRTLWLLNVEGGGIVPLSAASPSHIAFVAQRPDAIVADDVAREVFLLQGLDQNPTRLPGAVQRGEAGGFSAVAASRDGQFLFSAQHGSEDISITNLQTRESVVVPCHCTPTAFQPFKGNSIFRLNSFSSGPLTVLDASSPNPRTLIIPISAVTLSADGRAQ